MNRRISLRHIVVRRMATHLSQKFKAIVPDSTDIFIEVLAQQVTYAPHFSCKKGSGEAKPGTEESFRGSAPGLMGSDEAQLASEKDPATVRACTRVLYGRGICSPGLSHMGMYRRICLC